MNDREMWRERIRDIRASGMTWWWWWWSIILGVACGIMAISIENGVGNLSLNSEWGCLHSFHTLEKKDKSFSPSPFHQLEAKIALVDNQSRTWTIKKNPETGVLNFANINNIRGKRRWVYHDHKRKKTNETMTTKMHLSRQREQSYEIIPNYTWCYDDNSMLTIWSLQILNEWWLNDWFLTEMSTHLILCQVVWNHIHYVHIYIFWVVVFCAQRPIKIQIFKQIYLNHKWDPNRYYHSRLEWT